MVLSVLLLLLMGRERERDGPDIRRNDSVSSHSSHVYL